MELDTLFEEFNTKLEALIFKELTMLERANMVIIHCETTLADLRTLIDKEDFVSEQEEIKFFKVTKPYIFSHLVYYREMQSCLLQCRSRGDTRQKSFLDAEAQRVQSHLDQLLNLRLYMELGATDRDAFYFTRKGLQTPQLLQGSSYYQDPLFSTPMDEIWGRILGLKKYSRFLKELENETESDCADFYHKGSPFTFTQSPTAAVELIYALKLAGYIDHGGFEIKAFTDFFSKVFNIEIRDPYSLFKQITQRKTHRTKHLQQLVDALKTALEARDEYIP